MDAQFLMDADLVQGLDELDQTAKPTQAPAEELASDARHAERLGMRTAAAVSSCSHACNHHLLFINFTLHLTTCTACTCLHTHCRITIKASCPFCLKGASG